MNRINFRTVRMYLKSWWNGRPDWEMAKYTYGYDRAFPDPEYPDFVNFTVWHEYIELHMYWIASLFAHGKCALFGHDWEGRGYAYANGDTGGDYMRCARCGLEIQHTYY